VPAISIAGLRQHYFQEIIIAGQYRHEDFL
jgi:hypothetical protein